MGPAVGAPVAEPTFNPEPAPVVEAVTSTETVSPPTVELGTFMIPGDPDSYSVGPDTPPSEESSATAMTMREELPAPTLAEPSQFAEGASVSSTSPTLETITAPSVTKAPETVVLRNNSEQTTTATTTTNVPAAPKVDVKIEHLPSKAHKGVREIKQISEPGQITKAKLTELPAELEALVGSKL